MNENEYELYMHHGRQAWVRKDLKGKHREHCLCYSCDKFHPGSDEWEKNCPLANLIYSLCKANKVLLPVWECEQFVVPFEQVMTSKTSAIEKVK